LWMARREVLYTVREWWENEVTKGCGGVMPTKRRSRQESKRRKGRKGGREKERKGGRGGEMEQVQ